MILRALDLVGHYPATIYDPNQPSTNVNYGKITQRSPPRLFRAALRVSF